MESTRLSSLIAPTSSLLSAPYSCLLQYEVQEWDAAPDTKLEVKHSADQVLQADAMASVSDPPLIGSGATPLPPPRQATSASRFRSTAQPQSFTPTLASTATASLRPMAADNFCERQWGELWADAAGE